MVKVLLIVIKWSVEIRHVARKSYHHIFTADRPLGRFRAYEKTTIRCSWVPLCGSPVFSLVAAVQGDLLAWLSPAREGQMSICLRRRDFVAELGGTAGCPLAARAQQGDRVRRIGVLGATK